MAVLFGGLGNTRAVFCCFDGWGLFFFHVFVVCDFLVVDVVVLVQCCECIEQGDFIVFDVAVSAVFSLCGPPLLAPHASF